MGGDVLPGYTSCRAHRFPSPFYVLYAGMQTVLHRCQLAASPGCKAYAPVGPAFTTVKSKLLAFCGAEE